MPWDLPRIRFSCINTKIHSPSGASLYSLPAVQVSGVTCWGFRSSGHWNRGKVTLWASIAHVDVTGGCTVILHYPQPSWIAASLVSLRLVSPRIWKGYFSPLQISLFPNHLGKDRSFWRFDYTCHNFGICFSIRTWKGTNKLKVLVFLVKYKGSKARLMNMSWEQDLALCSFPSVSCAVFSLKGQVVASHCGYWCNPGIA